MTKILLNAPALLHAKFRIRSYSRGKTYTTTEWGRGILPSAERDYRDAILNATYNAVYKHVNKPRGKSDPKVELLDWDIEYPTRVTGRNLRIETREKKDGSTYTVARDAKGRFTNVPKARRLSDEEVREAF